MIVYGLVRAAATDFVARLQRQNHPQVVFARALGTSGAIHVPYLAFVKINNMSCSDADVATINQWFTNAGATDWDLVRTQSIGTRAPRIKNPDTTKPAAAVVLVGSDDPQGFMQCADGTDGVYGAATVSVCFGHPDFNVIIVIWAAQGSDLPGVLAKVKECDPSATYQPLMYLPGTAMSPVLAIGGEPIAPTFNIEVSIDGTFGIEAEDDNGESKTQDGGADDASDDVSDDSSDDADYDEEDPSGDAGDDQSDQVSSD